MQFNCAYTELKDIHTLVENPKNNNKHPDRQIELLAKIIDYQGQRSPIVVSKRSGFITKGHGRLAALKKLGWTKAAVDLQDYENEAQEYADLVADNKIAELAEFDEVMMLDSLKELDMEDFDFELLGLDDFSLPDVEVLEPKCDEDEVPEVVDTRCKKGDVWLLGEHRLMCGDSTSIDDVEKLMDGAKADMVFTDPPYGISLETNYIKSDVMQGNTYKPIEGDFDDYNPDLILGIFEYCKEIFLWGANNFCNHIDPKGSWIVWDKSTEAADNILSGNFELCWSKTRHKYEMYRQYWKGMATSDKDQKRCHPTQKPVEMAEWFFGKWGKDKTNIIDLYGGSGSTLIACEKTNRKCYMMELDEHYCDVILSRWEKYTGNTAQRLEQ